MAVELTTTQHMLDWCGGGLGLLGAYTLAFRLRVSRYGWIAFFGANIAYVALAGQLGVLGLLAQQLGFIGSSAIGIYRNFFDRGRDQGEVELEHAWSISARLAAIPPSYLGEVPDALARLIREAQGLHPVMADGAHDRELRGDASALIS